jgi:hypothetical protein
LLVIPIRIAPPAEARGSKAEASEASQLLSPPSQASRRASQPKWLPRRHVEHVPRDFTPRNTESRDWNAGKGPIVTMTIGRYGGYGTGHTVVVPRNPPPALPRPINAAPARGKTPPFFLLAFSPPSRRAPFVLWRFRGMCCLNSPDSADTSAMVEVPAAKL